jgi:Microtubule associated protein (MAP65/ASE1 family)
MKEGERGPVEDIREGLRQVYLAAEKILPVGRETAHPLEAIRERLSGVVREIHSVRESLEEEVRREEGHIRELEQRIKELNGSVEVDFPGAVTLAMKKVFLEERASGLLEEYREKEREFTKVVEEIRRVREEYGEGTEVEEAKRKKEEVYWINEKEIERVRRIEKREKEELERRRREMEKDGERAEEMLRRIGVRVGGRCEEVFSRMGEIREALVGADPSRAGECSLWREGEQVEWRTFKIYRIEEMVQMVRETCLCVEESGQQLVERVEKMKSRVSVEEPTEWDGTVQGLVSLRQKMKELESEYKKRFRGIIKGKMGEAKKELENVRQLSGGQREGLLPTDESLEEIEEEEGRVEKIEGVISRLREEAQILKEVGEWMGEREILKEKMVVFEKEASDPRRLFRSSFQLVSEEKFRNMAVPTLLRLEKEILDGAQKYETLFGRAMEIRGDRVAEKISGEIGSRIMNKNIFVNVKPETPRKAQR